MSVPSLILDIGALVLLILCSAFYARKGFLSALVSFVGTLASVIAASLLANRLSPIVFNQYFRPGLEESAAAAIADQTSVNIDAVLNELVGFLPDSVIATIGENMEGSINLDTGDLAAQLIDQVVAPLVIPIITMVLFLVVFLLLRLLVGLLSKLLTGLNHVPLLGAVNSGLGAVAGVFLGALYVVVVVAVLGLLDAAYGEGAISEAWFTRSIVWKLLSNVRFLS